MWGQVVLGAVVVLGVGVAVRLLSPVDYHLNRVSLQKGLQAIGQLSPGERVSRLKISKIPVATTDEMNMERVFQRIEIETNGGRHLQFAAQSFYPLAVLFEEREKKRQPMIASQAQVNPYHLTPPDMGMNPPPQTKDDPIKNEVEEAEVKNKKISRLQEEVEQLKKLNRFVNLFPQLLSFDQRKLLTIISGVGDRLDYVLTQLDQSQRGRVLRQIVRQLAEAHQTSPNLVGQLLPGPHFSDTMMRNLLELGISLWPKGGVMVSESHLRALMTAAEPLIQNLQKSETGLKLGEATPRSFYWNGEQAQQLDWGRARISLTCFDLAELLCDPVSDLTIEQEMEIIATYQEFRGLDNSFLWDVTCASLLYRMVLAGYISQHLYHANEMTADQRLQLGGINWDEKNLSAIFKKILWSVKQHPDLAEFSRILENLGLPN